MNWQIYGKTDRPKEEHRYTKTKRHTDGRTDKEKEGSVDRQTDIPTYSNLNHDFSSGNRTVSFEIIFGSIFENDNYSQKTSAQKLFFSTLTSCVIRIRNAYVGGSRVKLEYYI